MKRASEIATAAAVLLFGGMWLLAAGTKMNGPLPAFELAARAVPDGLPAKTVLAVIVGGEVLLGAAMVLRVVRGLGWSLAALLLATAAVWFLKMRAEQELLPCGCFGKLFGTTLDGALVRNGVLMAVHVGLILWNRLAR